MSADNEIGGRLRRERRARGWSLRKVADEVGVSASLISQVETGKTQPSVATLYALASLMSVSVDDLLGLETSREPLSSGGSHLDLQRAAENPSIEMENGVRWERLAVGRDDDVEPLLVTYEPGASSSLEGKFTRHAGSEYAYVLGGEITLKLEFETYVLSRGDSIHFDSTRPHLFANHGSVPATGLWFVVGHRDGGVSAGGGTGARQSTVRSSVDVLARLDELSP